MPRRERPAPNSWKPLISPQDVEFIVRLKQCDVCGCREASIFYEFVGPGRWRCETCAKQERNKATKTEEVADGRLE